MSTALVELEQRGGGEVAGDAPRGKPGRSRRASLGSEVGALGSCAVPRFTEKAALR